MSTSEVLRMGDLMGAWVSVGERMGERMGAWLSVGEHIKSAAHG